jgi:hypothetical protein
MKIELPSDAIQAIARNIAKATALAKEHQMAIGIAEMALGAGILYAGVQSGAVVLGTQILATAMPAALAGTGGSIGAAAASLVGSIGVAAMGTAFGVPALVVTAGAAGVFALAGFAVGSGLKAFLAPPWHEAIEPLGMTLVGITLILDGARRVLGDANFAKLNARVTGAFIELGKISRRVVARTLAQLQALKPEDMEDAVSGAAAGGAMAILGGAGASSLAMSSVTVMGSSTLGSAALALGLVSAPVWPVVAGGLAGGALGYAVWKGFSNWGKSRQLSASESEAAND